MNLKDIIDILVSIWPYMYDTEKDELCISITNGNLFSLGSTFVKIKDNVIKRVGGNK